MQNTIIKFDLYDNTVDKYVLINPTMQQFFTILREESQMFPGASFAFQGNIATGYTNDPDNQNENRDSTIDTIIDDKELTSFTPTDYAGVGVYSVPKLINENFSNFKLYDLNNFLEIDLYSNTDNLKTISNGIQLVKIPANKLNTTLTDPADIIANNNSNIKMNYGNYLVRIYPKYIQAILTSVAVKKHFPLDKLDDNKQTIGGVIYPVDKRRNIYECDVTNFLGTDWNFELQANQSGRLLGSVIEIWNSSENILKQTKVISENKLTQTKFKFCMSPDHMGYDPADQDASVGDIIRIYPRETYFDQITIDLNYEDGSTSIKSVLSFLTNDVARDMKTGIYEIYDSDGLKIDSTGNFDGKVILSYQVEQFGNYEIRKKIKI